jgi:hypothetical protein
MSLEDEIRRDLRQAFLRNQKVMEQKVRGGEVELSPADMLIFLSERVEALREAVLRLARELDERVAQALA